MTLRYLGYVIPHADRRWICYAQAYVPSKLMAFCLQPEVLVAGGIFAIALLLEWVLRAQKELNEGLD